MEVFSPYENYVYIALGVYLLIIIVLLIKSSRFARYGVQTKATIISIHSEEYEVSSGGSSDEANYNSTRYKALIEFETKETEQIKAKISIAKRYLKEEYKTALPIIYHQGRPKKPMINDDLYIYQLPLGLLLILIIFGTTIFCIMSMGGGQ